MTSTMLFQYHSTSANSTTTTGDLIFVAPTGGPTLLTALWVCPSAGGNSEVVRMHHAREGVGPSESNMVMRFIASFRENLDTAYASVKLLMDPGDALYAALHSGTGITITGYGLTSVNVSEFLNSERTTTDGAVLTDAPTRTFAEHGAPTYRG